MKIFTKHMLKMRMIPSMNTAAAAVVKRKMGLMHSISMLGLYNNH